MKQLNTEQKAVINEKTADVLFFHDSLGKNINDTIFKNERLSTKKILTYHLADVCKKLPRRSSPPRAVIIHTLTNDITKKTNSNILTQELEYLVNTLKETYPTTKIILSNIVSRATNTDKCTYMNLHMNLRYKDDADVSTCSHDTITQKDRWTDGIHLEKSGTGKLASNIKKATLLALGMKSNQ